MKNFLLALTLAVLTSIILAPTAMMVYETTKLEAKPPQPETHAVKVLRVSPGSDVLYALIELQNGRRVVVYVRDGGELPYDGERWLIKQEQMGRYNITTFIHQVQVQSAPPD